ncbi:hypothetical protein EBX93_04155 [bacterium]|nr:hypothetical protein [bacterium]
MSTIQTWNHRVLDARNTVLQKRYSRTRLGLGNNPLTLLGTSRNAQKQFGKGGHFFLVWMDGVTRARLRHVFRLRGVFFKWAHLLLNPILAVRILFTEVLDPLGCLFKRHGLSVPHSITNLPKNTRHFVWKFDCSEKPVLG